MTAAAQPSHPPVVPLATTYSTTGDRGIIPTAPASDRWARSATGGPRALIGGVADRRRGHDGGGHAEGAGRGRAATGGGPVPGRAGGTPHAGARPRAGGQLARGRGAGGRHGPADLARL